MERRHDHGAHPDEWIRRGDCGRAYDTGKRYLLFAIDWSGDIYHGLCQLGEVNPSPSSELVRYLAPLPTLPLAEPPRFRLVGIGLGVAFVLLVSFMLIRFARARRAR